MAYKKSEISKKAIIDAAKQLSEEKGYDRMSVRDICKLTGLSIGGFYHHFSAKDDLLNESFILFDSTITREAFAAYDVMNPIDAIKSILINQTRFSENIGVNLMREYYRALLQGRGRGAIDAGRAYYKAVRLYVERAQAQGLLVGDIPAEEITEFLIKNVRGSLLDWCLHDGGYCVTDKLGKELDRYLSTFVRGDKSPEMVEPVTERTSSGQTLCISR